MPTYQYVCTDCGEALEVQQSFSEDSLTTCPNCSGRLRKVFNAVGVVFKGSGFYRTDSRASAEAKAEAAAGSSSDKAGSDKKADAGTSSSDKPAAASGGSKDTGTNKADKSTATKPSTSAGSAA